MPDLDTELTAADDDTIRAALEHAVVPALLPALAGALGDPSLIPDHLRPDLSVLMDPTAGLSPEQEAEARSLALGALQRLRDGAAVAVPEPAPDDLQRALRFASGGRPVEGYLELVREELALGEDLRTPTWRKDDVAPDRRFRVAVIGAGMSGLVAAHRLRQAGLDVVVLEKNDDVGGTWLENRYPAAGSTCRTSSTATPSPAGPTGRSTSRRSPSSTTTSAPWPRTSGCSRSSASAPRSPPSSSTSPP
jgi:4-hydroxyacetophenone monooxygenase